MLHTLLGPHTPSWPIISSDDFKPLIIDQQQLCIHCPATTTTPQAHHHAHRHPFFALRICSSPRMSASGKRCAPIPRDRPPLRVSSNPYTPPWLFFCFFSAQHQCSRPLRFPSHSLLLFHPYEQRIHTQHKRTYLTRCQQPSGCHVLHMAAKSWGSRRGTPSTTSFFNVLAASTFGCARAAKSHWTCRWRTSACSV
jgi:hypothetical protein